MSVRSTRVEPKRAVDDRLRDVLSVGDKFARASLTANVAPPAEGVDVFYSVSNAKDTPAWTASVNQDRIFVYLKVSYAKLDGFSSPVTMYYTLGEVDYVDVGLTSGKVTEFYLNSSALVKKPLPRKSVLRKAIKDAIASGDSSQFAPGMLLFSRLHDYYSDSNNDAVRNGRVSVTPRPGTVDLWETNLAPREVPMQPERFNQLQPEKFEVLFSNIGPLDGFTRAWVVCDTEVSFTNYDNESGMYAVTAIRSSRLRTTEKDLLDSMKPKVEGINVWAAGLPRARAGVRPRESDMIPADLSSTSQSDSEIEEVDNPNKGSGAGPSSGTGLDPVVLSDGPVGRRKEDAIVLNSD